jgi:hypothetical protein
MKALLAVLLALPVIAHADALVCNSGMLTPVAQTATGPTVNTVSARKATALAFQVRGTGTATVAVEMCCFATCTTAADWAPLAASSMSLAAGVSAGVSLLSPASSCNYRGNVTACTGCSVSVVYSCAVPDM